MKKRVKSCGENEEKSLDEYTGTQPPQKKYQRVQSDIQIDKEDECIGQNLICMWIDYVMMGDALDVVDFVHPVDIEMVASVCKKTRALLSPERKIANGIKYISQRIGDAPALHTAVILVEHADSSVTNLPREQFLSTILAMKNTKEVLHKVTNDMTVLPCRNKACDMWGTKELQWLCTGCHDELLQITCHHNTYKTKEDVTRIVNKIRSIVPTDVDLDAKEWTPWRFLLILVWATQSYIVACKHHARVPAALYTNIICNTALGAKRRDIVARGIFFALVWMVDELETIYLATHYGRIDGSDGCSMYATRHEVKESGKQMRKLLMRCKQRKLFRLHRHDYFAFETAVESTFGTNDAIVFNEHTQMMWSKMESDNRRRLCGYDN